VAVALLGDGAVVKAGEVAPAASEEVITDVGQFWRLTGDARRQPHHVQLSLVVCYYDPQWRLLWGLDDVGISFIRCGEKRYPIHPGQSILVDGFMAPATGLSLESADIKILAEKVPLQPVPWRFQGKAEDAAKLPAQLVVMDGFVNRQTEIDAAHVLLDMTVGGWPVQARVLRQNAGVELQCETAFVEIQGVLVPTAKPAGQLSDLALWVVGPEDVEIKGWLSTDPRFNQAQVPIEMLPKIAADQIVRVIGTVREQEPGHSLTIRNDTGQVVILTGQTQLVQFGRRVEAIGHPMIQGEKWQLQEGLFRPLSVSQNEEETSLAVGPTLRLAEQVLELGYAAYSRPVRLLGVATWTDPRGRFFYVNDASGGIRVLLDNNQGPTPVPGQAVEVEGVAAAGDFAPIVRASSITVAGTMSMPEAEDVGLERALTGVEDGRWIELRGYVQEIAHDGSLARLRLTAAAGEFTAYLPSSEGLAALRGSAVRMRGVCSAMANYQHELVGIRLLVPSSSSEYLQAEQEALPDSISVPQRSIASLRQYNTLRAINRRVRIEGVVLLQIPGRYLYVQEGTDSLQVLSRDTAALDPGDRVEVVGFPGWEGSRLVLREAACRRRAAGAELPPTALDAPEVVQKDLDGHLVRIGGDLLAITDRIQELRLVIKAGKTVFEAALDHGSIGSGQIQWVPGSRLVLTGVYVIQFDEYRRPRAFLVQLRSPRDIAVLSRPSWWTLRRALGATGGCALVIALGIGWILILRRQVRRRTAQVRA
jgi:hypothetical protein